MACKYNEGHQEGIVLYMGERTEKEVTLKLSSNGEKSEGRLTHSRQRGHLCGTGRLLLQQLGHGNGQEGDPGWHRKGYLSFGWKSWVGVHLAHSTYANSCSQAA